MRRRLFPLTVLTLLLSASAAQAQEYDTSRRSWLFFGRDLSIEVSADSPGAIQIVRGEPGRLEVAGLADHGLTAFGLGGYSGTRLRLNALGASNVSYIVVVPERVHVSLSVPGQQHTRMSDEPGAVFRWDVGGSAPEPPEAVIAPAAGGLFLVHHGEDAPAQVLLHPQSVRRVQVRIEGERFQVESTEPLVYHPSSGAPLRVRAGERPIDLVLTLPAATRFFQLRADGEVLLAVEETRATTGCERALSVRTPAGRRFEFVATEGQLRCR